MKKLFAVSAVIVVFAFILIASDKNFQDRFTIISTLGIFVLLMLSYVYLEKSSAGTKDIAVIATLGAFAGVSRMVFAPLPGIKPITFIVAISGYVYGPSAGFLIGSSSAFISNIFFGQGPWTPWQMFSWGLVGFASGLLGKKHKNITAFNFSLLCFTFGLVFDWIMNLYYLFGFVKPITINAVITAYLSGLTFDILHAGGSFMFSIIFFDGFLKVLLRYKRRLDVTYIDESHSPIKSYKHLF